jgi:hypothetical protein
MTCWQRRCAGAAAVVTAHGDQQELQASLCQEKVTSYIKYIEASATVVGQQCRAARVQQRTKRGAAG